MKANVFVAGYSACGKSTQVKKIAKKFNLKPVFTSKIFRKKYGKDSKSIGFWESSKGMAFLNERLRDLSKDKDLDRELIKVAEKGGSVFDSWTLPWLFKGKSVKIWLKASEEQRAKRMSERNKIPFAKALEKLKERDKKNKQIYFQAYSFRFGEDLQNFDLIINTEKLNEKEVFSVISAFLKTAIGKK